MTRGWLDPALAIAPPQPYVYKSTAKRLATRLLDGLGDLMLAPPPMPLDGKALRRVAVLRLDHLGDVLNALPAVQALRAALPWAELDFWVGPWGRAAAGLAWPRLRLRVFEAPWYCRPPKSASGAVGALARGLAEANYDLCADLRGDLRHHWAAFRAGIPFRIGHWITGGRFLLSHPARYRPGIHEMEQNFTALEACGLPVPLIRPIFFAASAGNGSRAETSMGTAPVITALPARVRLRLPASAQAEAMRMWRKLRLGRSQVLALQVTCGAASKRWLSERWIELLDRLPRRLKPALLGSASELPQVRELAARCRRPVALAAGLSLEGLAAFLLRCRALVSLDSGPAHLAAILGVPVLGLYAGTVDLRRWAPRGRRVRILQAQVPCAPCNLGVCPYSNECMRRISVEEVLEALASL